MCCNEQKVSIFVINLKTATESGNCSAVSVASTERKKEQKQFRGNSISLHKMVFIINLILAMIPMIEHMIGYDNGMQNEEIYAVVQQLAPNGKGGAQDLRNLL